MSVGETVVQFQDVSFVQFQDFTIDCARMTGINAQNGLMIEWMDG